MTRAWPDSHLKALNVAFGYLSTGPAPLALDCAGVPGLPQAAVPVGELRDRLVRTRRALDPAARDEVWRRMLRRTRAGHSHWRLAATGMAVPGLIRAAGRLARGWSGDTRDLDADLLVGFVERMATVPLEAPRICGKLIDAAIRAARRSRTAADLVPLVRIEGAWSMPPRPPWDHPDCVLIRAAAATVIDEDELELIGDTRLGDVPSAVVAARLGLDVKLAAARRRAGERRLRDAIHAGALEHAVTGAPAHERATHRLSRLCA